MASKDSAKQSKWQENVFQNSNLGKYVSTVFEQLIKQQGDVSNLDNDNEVKKYQDSHASRSYSSCKYP